MIKVNDMGPSPAKMPKLEYGPQLPPCTTIEVNKATTSQQLKPVINSNGIATNGITTSANGEDGDENKPKTSKKKLRRKRLKKLMRQIRQGELDGSVLTEKQLNLAKTKNEKRKLKKLIKKKKADSSKIKSSTECDQTRKNLKVSFLVF